MTDELYERFKRTCLDWRDLLGLQEWEITFTRPETPVPATSILIEEKYLRAIITVGEDGFEEKHLEDIPCHEMCHLFLHAWSTYHGIVQSYFGWEQKDIIKEFYDVGWERTTEQLSRLVRRLHA